MASGGFVTAEQTPMLMTMMRRKLLFVLVAFLFFTSKSLGQSVTTAPVVVVEEEERADRGDKVAETASGIYEQLIQDKHVLNHQRCPSNISVVMNHEKDEEYNVKLPGGLVDVNGVCKPLDNFKAQTMAMKNFGRAISTLAVVLSKSTLMEHSTHLTGELPEGALKCPSSSFPSADETTTFGKLSITSLKEPITLLLRMALERIGVPSETLDGAFKSREKVDEWVSDRQALNENAWRVQAAMRPLEMTFALILGPKTEDGGEGNILGIFKDACFYMGGKQSFKSVMQKIKNLVSALIPLARHAQFPRFDLPVPDFFSLRKPCKINSNANSAMNQLSLERITSPDLNESVGEEFAVRLNGGKDACARVNITRFIQAEKRLNTSNPSSPGAYVVNLVDEMIDMFDRFGAGSTLFRRLRADEQVAGYFPDILRTLARFEFKTNILVGTADLSNCTGGSNATFVLINRPSIMIECGDGLTNSTCISKKDVMYNEIPVSDNSEAQAHSERQVFDESSLLLVPGNKPDACVFSTLSPVG